MMDPLVAMYIRNRSYFHLLWWDHFCEYLGYEPDRRVFLVYDDVQ